jgi:hypothetical protein
MGLSRARRLPYYQLNVDEKENLLIDNQYNQAVSQSTHRPSSNIHGPFIILVSCLFVIPVAMYLI